MNARKGMSALELLLMVAALALVAWMIHEGVNAIKVTRNQPEASTGPATAHDAEDAVENAGYQNAQFTKFWRTVDVSTLGCKSRDERAFSVLAEDAAGTNKRFLVCCRGRSRNKVCTLHEH